jgi:hypothetical protein
MENIVLLDYGSMFANKKYCTLGEYFELERESEIKYEWYNGLINPLPASTKNRQIIVANLKRHFSGQLEKTNYQIFDESVHLETPSGLITHPALTIVHGEPQFKVNGSEMILTNPHLTIGITHYSIYRHEYSVRRGHLLHIPSHRHLIDIQEDMHWILQLANPFVDQVPFERIKELCHVTDNLVVPEMNIRIKLAEIYEGIEAPKELDILSQLLLEFRPSEESIIAFGNRNQFERDTVSETIIEFVKAQIGYPPFLHVPWSQIDLPTAKIFATSFIAKDLAYGGQYMPNAVAVTLFDFLISIFGNEINVFVHGNTQPPYLSLLPEGYHWHWYSGSWGQITGATFEAGIVLMNKEHIGILWFSDED